MRNGRLTVLQPLQLLSVRRFGCRLRIVVRDPSRRRHLIVARVPTSLVARSHAAVMLEWAKERASLAYVRGHGSAAFVDVDALLARAL